MIVRSPAACSETRYVAGSCAPTTPSASCQAPPPPPPICRPRRRTVRPLPRFCFCSLYGTRGEVVDVGGQGPVLLLLRPTARPILRRWWPIPLACPACHGVWMRHLKVPSNIYKVRNLCGKPLVLDMILVRRLSYDR